VQRVSDGMAVRIVPPEPTDRYVPSADRALISAAKTAGERVVAAVLTGMGDDGAKGVSAVKAAGGKVYVQSPDSAVLDGMPRSALRSGAADHALPLKLLSEEVARVLLDE
jgi:two-component system chemotaxis response regulator CheB